MEAALPLLLTFGLMWFLLIRPQQRRMRQHQAIVSSLRIGDEIVTAGGIFGTVSRLDDDAITLEVAPGVEMRVLRAAVSQRAGPPEADYDTADDVELDDAELDDAVTDEADLDQTDADDIVPSVDGEEPGTTAGRSEPSSRDDEPK